jgi:selenocysteine-specific elongation factor
VVTGTVLGGSIRQGQTVDVHPLRKTARIRTIQTFGESRESADAGDRVGLNIPDLDHQQITRGCYISDDEGFMSTKLVYAKLQRNDHYKGRITPRMIVSATVGMPSSTGDIIPVEEIDDKLVIIDDDLIHDFDCVILLHRVLAVRSNMKVLVMRTDLPPTSMRIVATGFVEKPLKSLKLHKKKKRIGHIQRIRDQDTLVEGLASKKEIASTLVGVTVKTDSGVTGTVRDTFGTRGVVSVQFDGEVKMDENVTYERLIEEVLELGS